MAKRVQPVGVEVSEMPDEVIRREETARYDVPSLLDRISWGAVWAGVVSALGMQILFVLFGLFIGFAIFNPAAPGQLGGVSFWSKIWYLVTAACSLFFGGWVAARLGVTTNRRSGALHGITTWGLASVAVLVIMLFSLGALVSDTLGAVRTAVVASAGGAAPATPPVQVNPQAATANAASWFMTTSLFLWLGSLVSLCTGILGGMAGARYRPPAGAEVSPRDRERLAA
jgi:hypothetical protein